MAVKVGNGWGLAASSVYTSKSADLEVMKTNQDLLKELSEKYTDIQFSMSQSPLNGAGTNHIGISAAVLQQMQRDAGKKAEYEALIADCVQSLRNAEGGQTGGFFIHSDGSLSGWSVKKSGGQNIKSVVALNKGNTNNWQSQFSAMQEKQEKAMQAGWARMCRMLTAKNTTVRMFRNPDGTIGRISVTKPTKKKTKKLYYNFKRVSSMILRSKTSINARQAVRMARSQAALLRRRLGTGQYNDSELSSAIIHAEKMVKIAKKKQKHLIDEERAEKKISSGQTDAQDPELLEEENEEYFDEDMGFEEAAARVTSEEELQELLMEMQELMEDSMESLEEANEMDLLTEEMFANWDDMEPEDLEKRKKKHRADELREVTEADMKYLRSLFNRLEREKDSPSCGVSLELGGNEVPFVPLDMPMTDTGGSVDVAL